MAFKMLSAVTTTGASNIVYLAEPSESHTVSASFTSGTAVVIALEGSLEGRESASPEWFALATHTFSADEITAKQAMFHVASKPVKAVRLNLTTFTTAGGNLTARYQSDNLGGV